jgi:catechol 2,3-dioxygenase-like lactoylglutathione lyase family enzyme
MKPVMLSAGTLVSVDIARARRMYEDILGFECAIPEPGLLLVRHPAKPNGRSWVLEVREVKEITHPQTFMNHWGVSVATAEEVDAASARIAAVKDQYGILRVQQPRTNHGSHSFYFEDGDHNWWEVEYRPPATSYAAVAIKGRADY